MVITCSELTHLKHMTLYTILKESLVQFSIKWSQVEDCRQCYCM